MMLVKKMHCPSYHRDLIDYIKNYENMCPVTVIMLIFENAQLKPCVMYL